MNERSPAWLDANQRSLMAAIAEVRDAVARHLGAEVPETTRAAEAAAAPTALDLLCERFALSPFERSLLLLCAGVELDAAFARLCASASPEQGRPTFSMALAALPDAHWSAITPGAALRQWRMLELSEPRPASLLTAPLHIDERILHYLAGIQQLDERLAGLVDEISLVEETLVPSHAAIAARISALLANEAQVVQLCGRDSAAQRAVASAACRAMGLHLLAVEAASVPTSPAELMTFARLCDRESALTGSAILIDATDVDVADAHAVRPLARLAESLSAPLFVATRDSWQTIRRSARRFDVPRPTKEEQLALWSRELGPVAASLNGDLPRVVAQFDLGTAAIAEAASQAREAVSEGVPIADGLWSAGRASTRPSLESLARRIEPVARRHDLVLPESQLQQLDEIGRQVEHRATVYETWGLGRGAARGLGITTLFAGPSGTGKTLAAEVLAGELRLDLYAVDLSSVVSKYIGETEKNLRKVFDAAEDGGAVLFFDEADALFGKRSEVRDSHDRYANIEINYLLQRMESYRGLAVLATNRKGDLDPAFTRRIRFIVNFPFPDPAARAELWRRAFPDPVPRESLDLAALARLDLTGGSIRNVALGAAFAAAAAGGGVTMEHVLAAARREQAKLDRPVAR
jgi:hypothetical protein